MNALTLPQPSATLIALGVQTLFTTSRPAPKGVVGERLAIHAGAKAPGEMARVGDWFTTFRPTVHLPDGTPIAGRWIVGSWPTEDVHPLPLGAVVASCIVTDVVPVVGNDLVDPPYVRKITVAPGEFLVHRPIDGPATPLDDQLPYADLRPGRWAWLLSDVAPTDVRCPTCWGRGATDTPDGVHSILCATCGRAGFCPPIPATGRPGLWRWEP